MWHERKAISNICSIRFVPRRKGCFSRKLISCENSWNVNFWLSSSVMEGQWHLFSLDGASSNLSLSIVHWRWVKVLPNYHFQNRFFPIDYWQHLRRIKSAEREGQGLDWWQKIAYGLGRDRKTFSNGGLLIQLCFSSLNQMTLSLSTVQSTLTYGFYP